MMDFSYRFDTLSPCSLCVFIVLAVGACESFVLLRGEIKQKKRCESFNSPHPQMHLLKKFRDFPCHTQNVCGMR